MLKRNPFTPGSGLLPPYLAGRETEQRQFATVLNDMKNSGVGQTIVMYGPRGTGKTVLLNWFEAECSKTTAVAIKATPSRILSSLDALPELFLSENKHRPSKVAAGIGGVKAEWDMRSPGSQRKLEQALIEECKSRPRILLLDEAHTLDPKTCQGLLTLAQEVAAKAPFLLVLAGTPGLKPFLMSVGATFVERSEMFSIGRLSEQAAAKAVSVPLQQNGISIEDHALVKVVEDAQCYPYFLQLWGRGLWEDTEQHKARELTHANVDRVEPSIEARRRKFYVTRYNALSNDRPLLAAAYAVATAFQGKDSLPRSTIPKIIEDSLTNTLTDKESRQDEAHRLSQELIRIDFVWDPSDSFKFIPGIPSFMTFVRSCVEQEKELENDFERKKERDNGMELDR